MKPFFLITLPRSGGTALARMLGAERDECAAPALEAARQLDLPGLLAGRGWRSILFGSASWKDAVGSWSWLLKTFPGVPVIFLTRQEDPDGRYELTLFGTLKKWIPDYGGCFGKTLNKTRQHRQWMEDFHTMNPERTILVDHADLGDHATLRGKLGDLAPTFEAWEQQEKDRPESVATSKYKPDPNPQAFEGWDAYDFHADPFAGDVSPEEPAEDEESDSEDENPYGAKRPVRIHVRKPPRPFIEVMPETRRAIVYPWLSTAAVWREIDYSLRSIHENFTDRECPIYILGDAPPPGIRLGGRVKWRAIQSYAPKFRGQPLDRRSGMWHATVTGVQLADEVCWMNDDIYFLRPTGWEDLRIALTEGRLDDRVDRLIQSPNIWRRGLGRAISDLQDEHPNRPVWRFATHTPFLFERSKSLEILRTYRLSYKGSWVTLYHNHHGTPHEPCGPHKVNSLPASPAARFLNHNNHTLTPELRARLEERFPTPAPWEAAAKIAMDSAGDVLCSAP